MTSVARAALIVVLLCASSAPPPLARSRPAERGAELSRAVAAAERAADSGAASAVVVLVRHAEKTSDPDDPSLTRRGRRRAKRLARLLGEAGVDRLYASEYRRTQLTLAPLARARGLEVEVRPGRAIAELARELRELEPGTLAVVAGHSNTVPSIIRALGATPEVDEIAEEIYDRVFVVTIGLAADDGSRVSELRFDP